jgi:hypothetical protein
MDQCLKSVIDNIAVPAKYIRDCLDEFSGEKRADIRFSQAITNETFVLNLTITCTLALSLATLASLIEDNEMYDKAKKYLFDEKTEFLLSNQLCAECVYFVFEREGVALKNNALYSSRKAAFQVAVASA